MAGATVVGASAVADAASPATAILRAGGRAVCSGLRRAGRVGSSGAADPIYGLGDGLGGLAWRALAGLAVGGLGSGCGVSARPLVCAADRLLALVRRRDGAGVLQRRAFARLERLARSVAQPVGDDDRLAAGVVVRVSAGVAGGPAGQCGCHSAGEFCHHSAGAVWCDAGTGLAPPAGRVGDGPARLGAATAVGGAAADAIDGRAGSAGGCSGAGWGSAHADARSVAAPLAGGGVLLAAIGRLATAT